MTGNNAAVYHLAAANSTTWWSVAGNGWLVEWSLDQIDMGKLIAKTEETIFSVAATSNGKYIVLGNQSGGLHWIHREDPTLIKNVAHHKKGVFALIAVGNYLFSGGADGVLTRWNADTATSIESVHLSNLSIRSLLYLAQAQQIAVGCSDGNIYFLNAKDLSLANTLEKVHVPSVFCLGSSKDEQWLVSGGRDAHLQWTNLKNGETIRQPAHLYTVNTVAVHPTLPIVASASRDRTIKLWDVNNGKLLQVLESVRDHGHINSVNHLLWVKDGELLISGSDDRSLIAWRWQ